MTRTSLDSTAWEIVLKPRSSWWHFDLTSVWRYRDLLLLLVWRDFVAKYKQTVLGPLWFIIQPLTMTVVYTVIFSGVAGLSTDALPPVLFYMSGQLGWNYFAQTLVANSSTLVANAGLFGKVYFPRIIVPLSALISNLFAFGIQLATFGAFYLYFKYVSPAGSFGIMRQAVWLPLVIVHMAVLSLGVSLVMSSVTAKYRDLSHMMTLLIQVWMYVTPVIYPLSQFPQQWRWVAALNPMTPVIEAFRLMLLGTGTLEPLHMVWSVICGGVTLIGGFVLFSRVEKTFVDIV